MMGIPARLNTRIKAPRTWATFKAELTLRANKDLQELLPQWETPQLFSPPV